MRFIVRPGAVQHQNGAIVGAVVRGLHIFVASVCKQVANLPSQPRLPFRDHRLAQVAYFEELLAHFTMALAVKQQ